MTDAETMKFSGSLWALAEAVRGSIGKNGEFNSRTSDHSLTDLRRMADDCFDDEPGDDDSDDDDGDEGE